jgi:large subunit ribosomal protein L22
VRINPDKLKSLMAEAGVDAKELSTALAPEGASSKQQFLAERKIRNWRQGRLHPMPRAKEVSAIAERLGVPAGALARWTSTYRFARSSERKADLVVELIRGRSVDEASNLLRFSPKRAAVMVNKALQAAISDAEQADADVSRLVVSEARADKAVIIKRFQPKDRGRAHPIQKRTSHITVSVEEVA